MDLGAVTGYGRLFPIIDDLKVVNFFEASEDGLILRVVHFLPADVVAAALHVADLQFLVEVLLEEGDVLEEELFLKVFGAGGDDDAASGKDGGDEVCEGFAGTGTGLDNEVAVFSEGGFDGFGHLELAGAELVVGVPFREESATGEKLADGQGLGIGSLH